MPSTMCLGCINLEYYRDYSYVTELSDEEIYICGVTSNAIEPELITECMDFKDYGSDPYEGEE